MYITLIYVCVCVCVIILSLMGQHKTRYHVTDAMDATKERGEKECVYLSTLVFGR